MALIADGITTTLPLIIALHVIDPWLLLDLLFLHMDGMLRMQLTRLLVVEIRWAGARPFLLSQILNT